MEIVSEVKDELFNRKKVVAKMSFHASTPSRKEVMAELSKKLDVAPELLVLDKIHQSFGRHVVEIQAQVYSKKEDMKGQDYKIARTAGTHTQAKKEKAVSSKG
mgnify:CR=1 FL=1